MKSLSDIPVVENKFAYNRQSGFVLPLVLVIMAIIFGVGTVILTTAQKDRETTSNVLNYEVALLAGEGATSECEARLKEDFNYTGNSPGEIWENDVSVVIEVVPLSDTARYVEIQIQKDAYQLIYIGDAQKDTSTGDVWLSVRLARDQL